MALITFIDFSLPAVPAYYLNALDLIRNAMTGDSTGQELIVGAPTGGYQGPGTINAEGLFVNGVAVGGGGGTPGGADTEVQFNDGGAFGGSPFMTFNKISGLLTFTDLTVFAGLSVDGSGFYVGTVTPDPILLTTNTSTRVTIGGQGNIQISPPSSGNALEITAAAATYPLLLIADPGSDALLGLAAPGGGYQWDIRSDNGGGWTLRNATLGSPISLSVAASGGALSTRVNNSATLLEVGQRKLVARTMGSAGDIVATDAGRMINIGHTGLSRIANVAGSGLGEFDVVTCTASSVSSTVDVQTGTLYWFTGAGYTTGTRTIVSGSIFTIWCQTPDSAYYIWGIGIS